jgi:hypothetical protein
MAVIANSDRWVAGALLDISVPSLL